jgi:predicted HicB family RNase H-like nuclease
MARSKPDPDDYIIGDDADATDIDLDEEEFFYRNKRLREADAERVAEETLESIRRDEPSLEKIRRNRGRPSLTGKTQRSPQVAFRLTPELRAKVEARAKAEGKPVSQIARDALEQYLAS